MDRTNIENQQIELKEKIRIFFSRTQQVRTVKFCLVRDALAATLDKWSLFVLYNLGYYEVLRFNDLRSKIPDISARMLSTTLKKLESQEIVHRKVYAEIPPRVEYRLTAFGELYANQLIDLSSWFIRHHPTCREKKSGQTKIQH